MILTGSLGRTVKAVFHFNRIVANVAYSIVSISSFSNLNLFLGCLLLFISVYLFTAGFFVTSFDGLLFRLFDDRLMFTSL